LKTLHKLYEVKDTFRINLNGIGSLTSKQVQVLENLCNKLCSEKKVRFCGVINSMGKIVAGGFKDDIKPLDNEDQRRMLYTQSSLELSMKEDFDENLGQVNYITTYRDNVVLINIPMKKDNHLVLISAERNTDAENVVKYTLDLFKSNNVFGIDNFENANVKKDDGEVSMLSGRL
jgi:hypothetical protein